LLSRPTLGAHRARPPPPPRRSSGLMVVATFTADCGRTVDAAVNITIVDAPPILIDGEDLFVACDQADSVLVGVAATGGYNDQLRSEEHTSELQSREKVVCRHLLARE